VFHSVLFHSEGLAVKDSTGAGDKSSGRWRELYWEAILEWARNGIGCVS
jgi:hypothetical protein